MSVNPFEADPHVASRLQRYGAERAGALTQAVVPFLQAGILSAEAAAELVQRFDLADVSDLMLLLLPLARSRARPPISRFQVGAIGLEADSGDLIFGQNVEFPGTHLGLTVHGETCLATRAFHRGTRLAVIALGEAHPCAHCRQFLSEFAGSDGLALIDPLGHRLTLGQLYPWPFDPAYLGQSGAVAGRDHWPNLTPLAPMDPALLAAGKRAHTPYSGCPSAVLLGMRNGSSVAGSAIESVAFNPSMGPLQAALIEALARRHDYDEIASVTLAQVLGGAVDHAAGTADLLARIAPQAPLHVQGWTV